MMIHKANRQKYILYLKKLIFMLENNRIFYKNLCKKKKKKKKNENDELQS